LFGERPFRDLADPSPDVLRGHCYPVIRGIAGGRREAVCRAATGRVRAAQALHLPAILRLVRWQPDEVCADLRDEFHAVIAWISQACLSRAALRRSSSGWRMILPAAASAISRRADFGNAVKCPLTSQASLAGWTGTIRPTKNIRLRTGANAARPMLE